MASETSLSQTEDGLYQSSPRLITAQTFFHATHTQSPLSQPTLIISNALNYTP